jgi:hypothetical protein
MKRKSRENIFKNNNIKNSFIYMLHNFKLLYNINFLLK